MKTAPAKTTDVRVSRWALSKLEQVKDRDRVLLIDSHRLLSENDSAIDAFAKTNGFTVVVASTNLVFRELYEKAVADPDARKLMVVDRAPASRRKGFSPKHAPPPFYPDLLSEIDPEAVVELDPRQFLIERTRDPNWPVRTNSRGFATLIFRSLDGVLRAHANLRASDTERFTDNDFYRIVAYASLGVPESAFKKPDSRTFWRIGLLGHEAMESLESLSPEIIRPIKDELAKAPAPFCWFSNSDPEIVVRTCYLSVMLQQHFEQWGLLIANVDPGLLPASDIRPEILNETVPGLVALDPEQARADLKEVEESLDAEALELLFSKQIQIDDLETFTGIVEREKYSILFRSLALCVALENLLESEKVSNFHRRIHRRLFDPAPDKDSKFIDSAPSASWSRLKESFRLAFDILDIRADLLLMIKTLGITPAEKLTFGLFLKYWREKRIDRLEFYLSALERLVLGGDLIAAATDRLPSHFSALPGSIRKNVRKIQAEIEQLLGQANARFQELVVLRYPAWIREKTEVRTTSQFLERCLKPHWDPEKEKAAVFIFDGMRCDIWEELLLPLIGDRIEPVADYPATAILPTETHITRKAISAGALPESFDTRLGEDKLLREGLERTFGIDQSVETVLPDGSGVGETVRYQAGNLSVFIFELCDKELHKIGVKKHPDGSVSPSRPLSFVYLQHIKNILETEFMAVFKTLPPKTKVFATADHGFGPVGREPLWFDPADLNEISDCTYSNCALRVPMEKIDAPSKVLDNIVGFAPEAIGMPAEEDKKDKKTGHVLRKVYGSFVFPKPGCAFGRQGSPFNPDAWSHGGISLQEMMIPMTVATVKADDGALFSLGPIQGPRESVEGEPVEFSVRVAPDPDRMKKDDELRIEVEAFYGTGDSRRDLNDQVLYVPPEGENVVYAFKPDPQSASEEERRDGTMVRKLTVKAVCRKKGKTFHKTETCSFTVKLNSDKIVRRVPAHLGAILGLTPRSMR